MWVWVVPPAPPLWVWVGVVPPAPPPVECGAVGGRPRSRTGAPAPRVECGAVVRPGLLWGAPLRENLETHWSSLKFN